MLTVNKFEIGFCGISNIYGNEKNQKNFSQEINFDKALEMAYEQIHRKDKDLKNPKKNCGCGLYIFKDQKIVENIAGIIDIKGVRYKLLLMVKINPDKVRIPVGYENCFILNPTPNEVRPYKILIKKLFLSPMATASQNEIKIFKTMPSYYLDIINEKDTSFYKSKEILEKTNDYIIELYFLNYYNYINTYLRTGEMISDKYSLREIKSMIYCLHSVLNKSNDTKINFIEKNFYLGISKKIPNDLIEGTKFFLSEFISVTEDKSLALAFASHGTLFIIKIENTYSNNFCKSIEGISSYKNEKEILFTSNCTFNATKIEKDINGIDYVYLICEGYKIN